MPSAIRRLQGRRQSEQLRIPPQNHFAAGDSMTSGVASGRWLAPSVKLRTSLAD